MRENAQAKSRRILAEGRLSILRVDPRGAIARVRTDSVTDIVTYDSERGRWECTCDALSRCAHVWAAQGVIVVDVQIPLPLDVATAETADTVSGVDGP